jgi:NAD(P)-dependent dehydrogenase (short-subunit alcohol dehydrogenase family)
MVRKIMAATAAAAAAAAAAATEGVCWAFQCDVSDRDQVKTVANNTRKVKPEFPVSPNGKLNFCCVMCGCKPCALVKPHSRA